MANLNSPRDSLDDDSNSTATTGSATEGDDPYPLEFGAQNGETESHDSDEMLSIFDEHVRNAGRLLISAIPQLEEPLEVGFNLWEQAYVHEVRTRHNVTHRAKIDPYRIAWVDPDRIESVSKPPERSQFSRFRLLGTTMDGDWDRRDLQFTDTDVYCAFEAHFEDGRPWTETAFYRRIVEDIETGHHRWGCTTSSEFDRRCEQLDELYASIRKSGFKTQRDLHDDPDDPVSKRRPLLRSRIINDEIAVEVGRNGELLFRDGRNRFSIAKVLGVDEVPVVFLRRHADWVAFRDDVAAHVDRTGDLPSGLEDHPDLRHLVDRRA